jgi:hypothetical protein
MPGVGASIAARRQKNQRLARLSSMRMWPENAPCLQKKLAKACDGV